MEKEKPQINRPFKETPEFFRGSTFFKIAKKQKDPRFVILESRGVNKEREIKNIQKFISIFQDPKYGLLDFLAKNQVVVGETGHTFAEFSEKDEKSFYLIRERIDGKEIRDFGELPDDIAEQIDEFLYRNARVFIDTFKKDENIDLIVGLSLDIFTSSGGSGIWGNAFIGKNLVRGDKKDRFYFFDLYPVVSWDKKSFIRLSQKLIEDFKFKPGFQNKNFDFPKFGQALKEIKKLD